MSQSHDGMQDAENTGPTVFHEPGKLPEVLDAIEDAIAAMADEANIYIWGGALFRIYRLPEPEEGHIKRPAGAVLLHRVDATHLAELATKAASHFRYDKRSESYRPMDCPRRAADAVISRGHWPKLRPLHGVVEAPTITTKGDVVDVAGYHDSGLYLANVPQGYTSPSAAPHVTEARHAIQRIKEAVATFPFVSEADHVAAVAAVITGLVRRSLPSAPMIAITAPTPGTGKSLLSEAVAMVALGRQAAMLALGDDEAETEKRLYSALLAGDSLLIADNIETQLKGALLCQILTSPSVQFRPLGASVMATVPTATTLIATGNNLSIIGDLRRRVMLIRLDAATERPEQRTFKRDALAYVASKRGQLIRDALTITRAYLAAGTPPIDGLAPYGGFSDWDRLVRRPLVWAGLPDPLSPADVLRETDPDLETTRSMFSAWHKTFATDAATVAEAIAKARSVTPRFDGGSDPHHPELRDAIQAAAGDKLDSRRLGFWLRKHRDRIVDGQQLKQAEADSHAKVARWRVVVAG